MNVAKYTKVKMRKRTCMVDYSSKIVVVDNIRVLTSVGSEVIGVGTGNLKGTLQADLIQSEAAVVYACRCKLGY